MTYSLSEGLVGKFYRHNMPSRISKVPSYYTLANSKGTLTQLVIKAANIEDGIFLKKFTSTILI
jgi:hypothetical protein